ncbi:trypsin-like peptidase domain-containing protein [Micromonospora sp. NPDC047557]|uniref:trypsin-like peptidase domain-containing protein n=1 Tax=Micromonospora sp. NPDC047557 TaxID=3364250 RepID=UPI003718CCA4
MLLSSDGGDLTGLLTTAVCGISIGDRPVSGTGWLASSAGVVLTAGHLLSDGGDVWVTFPGQPPLPARVLLAAHRAAEGVDFAVLEVDPAPRRVAPFPVALVHSPRGSFTSAGYGVTLRSISAGAGEIIGPFDPHNDAGFRLFRCRSPELAEPGYSGAPILSDELGAVVGIQIEAVTTSRGARDTVLAMPLYRVASAWNRLEEIEAARAIGRDGLSGRQILVVTARHGAHGDRIAAGLRVHGFAVRQVVVGPDEILDPGRAGLATASVAVLVADGAVDSLAYARELVVATAVRQLPLIVFAERSRPLPPFVRGFPMASTVDEAVERVVAVGSGSGIRPAVLADALEEIQSSSANPGRFQPRIDELRSVAGGWASRRERQVRRIEALTTNPKPAAGAVDLAPAVGVRPFDPQHLFRNRVREATDISRALADATVGVVSVVGRAGIGKTALAARVLNALRAQRWYHDGPWPHVDGVVFLSTRTSSGISSEEVILKLAQLTGVADLLRSWSARAVPLHRRMAAVLEAVGERRIIILLDNLEDLLDDRGRLSGDDELGALLTELLQVAIPLSFLITSREPVELPPPVMSRTRTVELRTGLPHDEAVRMLRELDPQADYGLAVSTDEVLGSVSAAVHGLPRALQLVAGMLANDPLLTVDDLVAEMSAVNDTLDSLIAETLARLDQPARWVLLALAVAGRPIAVSGVDYILRPFAPGLDVPSLIRRLTRTQIVSGDRLTKRVALHPADRRYLLRQASEDRQEAIVALIHRRTAEYYLQIAVAVDEMRDVDDVRPVLFAAEHLLNSGDHHQVAEMLDQYGELLEKIGLYQATIDVGRALAEVAIGDDVIRNAMRLGRLYWLTGDAAVAMTWLTKAQEAAVRGGDYDALPAILVDLGSSQRDAGDLRSSLRTFRQAMRLAVRQGDQGAPVVARSLVQATHTLRPLGFLAASLSCADRAAALVIPRADASHTAALLHASTLINAAISEILIGATGSAETRLMTAQEITRRLGDRGLATYADCVLAGLARVRALPGTAATALSRALEAYEEIGDRWGLAAGLATLAWTYADLLDVAAATATIARGRVTADGCNPRASASLILAGSVLARRRGDLDAAVREAEAAIAAYESADFPMYGAWAWCELATAMYLRGEPLPAGDLFVRATPLTTATWQVLRALSLIGTEEAAAAIGVAGATLAQTAPGHAWRSLLAGWLAAAEACLSGAEPPAAVREVPETFAAAPGILHDHWQILARLAGAGLPGSPHLRSMPAP